MRLRILLPYAIFIDSESVSNLTASTVQGCFGILPHRRDCVVALRPGILTYRNGSGEDKSIAVDEGILVKAGLDVTVSARNAIGGGELGKLREDVEGQFSSLDERERDVRDLVLRMEASLVRRSVEFQRE